MAALPYMRFYPADYLADAAHLSAMQHGMYLLLLFNYWQRGGPLPSDEARLAKIAKVSMRDWKRNRDEIADFFTVEESHWRHSRVDAELAHVSAKSLKSKVAAQASVQRRFGERSTDVEPTDTEADTEKKDNKPPKGGYAFEGQVIRLSRKHFAAWAKAYPDVDLPAKLQSRDDWLATEAGPNDRERWFMSTSNYLANLQQKAKGEVQAASGWDGMP